MGDTYYSISQSNQFLANSNYNEMADGRRSHQIFSFNPSLAHSNQQQRNTVQDKRDIDKIMQRYSNPLGQDKAVFQSNSFNPQKSGTQSNYYDNQTPDSVQTNQSKGPVNFVNSQNFEDQPQANLASQKFQVNYPNLLDDDTSLMTSVDQSINQNGIQAQNGVINPFMKDFDNSINADAEDAQNNYDKFHQFEKLDLDQMAATQNNNTERVTFGFNNHPNIFELRQSQVNAQPNQQQINQQAQINFSLAGSNATLGRESQQSIPSYQQAQQPTSNLENYKFFSSPVGNNSNQSSNFAQSVSGQFGYNQQIDQFGTQSKSESNNYAANNNDNNNMILQDLYKDDNDNNIFGSDDDLTKQEEQEQRVNQMHAEISVLNDQVHKMLQVYKNQLDQQKDKKQVKQKVKQDASLLSKNYREIINKFEDLSCNNDVSQISINSKSNMSSFAGYSLLRGNTKKENEINAMMNLVEQFLCKFDDGFQNQSIVRQNQNQTQPSQNSIKMQQQQQDEKYKQIIRNQNTSEQKQPLLAQQYQLQNLNEKTQKAQVQQQQQTNYQYQQQDYQQPNNNQYQQSQQNKPSINLIVTPPPTNNTFQNKNTQIEQRFTVDGRMNIQPSSIQNSPQAHQIAEKRNTYDVNHTNNQGPTFNFPAIQNTQKQIQQQDLNCMYAKQPSGILSNQSSCHSTTSTVTSTQQGINLDLDKIISVHKKEHTDNPFNSSIQSPNSSIQQTNTPRTPQDQQFFTNDGNKNYLQTNIQIQQQIEQEDAVKRAQLPGLRQVSSAQPQVGYVSQLSTQNQTNFLNPNTAQAYSQSTRTSGINQFNLNSFSPLTNYSNPLTPSNLITPQVPTNNASNEIQFNNLNFKNNTLSPPQPSFNFNVQGTSNSNPASLANIPPFSKQSSQNPPISIGSITADTEKVPSQGTTQNDSRDGKYSFDVHEQLDLYCTNCDQYFKVGVYYDHVKICDKDHNHKLNQALDDTFYSLEQSTAIMNKLDNKIDKISRNISSVLQLQKLPQTKDILSQTIRDLADTLKSEDPQTVKKIIKKIEQNTRSLDLQSGNAPQSSSYKLYLYLKRVTNILREKETALEQSAMLKEISMVYAPKKPVNNENKNNNNLTTNIHPITAQLQQQQQQNLYAPRFSYQPNSTQQMVFNTNFTRNTVSTNSDLEKKSKFYDLAGEIKNKLPPNHFGTSFLISELYEEAKFMPDNQWQQFLLNKFKLTN